MRPHRLAIDRLARGALPALAALAAPLLVSAAALAQSAPPEPSLRQAPKPLLGYFIMFVLVAAVITISIMPSKRSHQD